MKLKSHFSKEKGERVKPQSLIYILTSLTFLPFVVQLSPTQHHNHVSSSLHWGSNRGHIYKILKAITNYDDNGERKYGEQWETCDREWS